MRSDKDAPSALQYRGGEVGIIAGVAINAGLEVAAIELHEDAYSSAWWKSTDREERRIMRHCRLFLAKFILIGFASLALVSVASVASAIEVTAYFYEISVAGTFGQTTIGQFVPDSTYPFPMMRGGSFDGVFVYDSWASVGPLNRFPYVSVDINIRDNTGTIVHTLSTSPNNFGVTSIGLALNFGQSIGIVNGLDDFRIFLNGAFTFGPPPAPPDYPDWTGLSIPSVFPPSPSEIVSGVLNFGFLATNLTQDPTTGFTPAWLLPVSTVSLSLTETTPYVREVPESANALLVSVGLFTVFVAVQRRKKRPN